MLVPLRTSNPTRDIKVMHKITIRRNMVRRPTIVKRHPTIHSRQRNTIADRMVMVSNFISIFTYFLYKFPETPLINSFYLSVNNNKKKKNSRNNIFIGPI